MTSSVSACWIRFFLNTGGDEFQCHRRSTAIDFDPLTLLFKTLEWLMGYQSIHMRRAAKRIYLSKTQHTRPSEMQLGFGIFLFRCTEITPTVRNICTYKSRESTAFRVVGIPGRWYFARNSLLSSSPYIIFHENKYKRICPDFVWQDKGDYQKSRMAVLPCPRQSEIFVRLRVERDKSTFKLDVYKWMASSCPRTSRMFVIVTVKYNLTATHSLTADSHPILLLENTPTMPQCRNENSYQASQWNAKCQVKIPQQECGEV
jgi:hypothetical protein